MKETCPLDNSEISKQFIVFASFVAMKLKTIGKFEKENFRDSWIWSCKCFKSTQNYLTEPVKEMHWRLQQRSKILKLKLKLWLKVVKHCFNALHLKCFQESRIHLSIRGRLIQKSVSVKFKSSSAAVRTGLLWLDNTSTCLHVRFNSNSSHHQLQYCSTAYCSWWWIELDSKRTWRLVLVLSSQRSLVRTAADDELN